MSVYGVLLTDNGWAELEGALAPFVREGSIGKYLYPSSVNLSGAFCHLEIKATDDSGFEAEIDIPAQFVKFVISAAEKNQIGFLVS